MFRGLGEEDTGLSLASCSYSLLQIIASFLINKMNDTKYIQAYFGACIGTNILFALVVIFGSLGGIFILVLAIPSILGIFNGMAVTGIILTTRKLKQVNDENVAIRLKCWCAVCVVLLLGALVTNIAELKTMF